jgi:adenine-specific DNA-methyltransferase
MHRTLKGLAEDAYAKSHAAAGERAFALWSDFINEALAGDEARLIFASEAAFAAAAREVLAGDQHLGATAAQYEQTFPHLYSSPLFSWYTPEPTVAANIRTTVEAFPLLDPMDVLSMLYEQSIPTAVRKHFGQFYTRPPLVRSMLDNIGFAGAAALSGRLIDPASGAGAFLIEATRRILDAADAADLTSEQGCVAVQKAIHGLDINPLGILLTEAAIALLLAPRLRAASPQATIEPLHLYVTDTLRAGELASEAHSDVAEAIKNRTGDYEDGFPFVVANPPYAKHPSRLLSDPQRRRFAATTFGHPNLYGLFLQVGVELLADGGRLSYINPKSFVSGAYFRNLRRFLAEQLDLQRFDTFAKRTGLFEGVLQEVVILSAVKSRGQSGLIQLREFAGDPDKAPVKDIKVDASSVLLGESFDWAFFVSPDPLGHRILARMTEDSRPLADYGFKVATGTIVWNRVKEHIRDVEGPDTRPLVWGNGIRYFRFAGLGNRAGAASHCALVKKTENIISYGPALLVKRMTAREELRRLVACRLPSEMEQSEAGYFAENHVNVVKPGPNASLDLDVVLGLLNSRLFDYVFRSLNGNTNVSATELELLPVADGPALDAVGEAARALVEAGGNDPPLVAELNAAVYNVYNIAPEDVEELEGAAADALVTA